MKTQLKITTIAILLSLTSGCEFLAMKKAADADAAQKKGDANAYAEPMPIDAVEPDNGANVGGGLDMDPEDGIDNNTTHFCGGRGLDYSPYEICSVRTLKNIALNLDAEYILTADINLSGDEWTPLGTCEGTICQTASNPFTGKLNGQGHKIRGLVVNQSNMNLGLFAAIQDAEISGIEFVNPSITGTIYLGALAGVAKNSDVIGVTISGDSQYITSQGRSGSLIGYADRQMWIENCHVQGGSVSGLNNMGGLVGHNDGSVVNSDADMNQVHGSYAVGGLVGYNTGTVQNSFSASDVTATEALAPGALVGTNTATGRVLTSGWGFYPEMACVALNQSGGVVDCTYSAE